MKKLFVVLFMLVTMNVNAQWANYTLPYGGIAFVLGFFGANTGVSCGHTFSNFDGQRMYYTSNAGLNWTMASYPVETRVLMDIQFINSTVVYAGGSENIFKNNTKDYQPGFENLPAHVRMGFISSGISEKSSEYKTAFLKSTNSGMSWAKVGVFDTLTGYMNNIHFFNANTGYALIDSSYYGNTRFYKTTNAGANWQMIRLVEAGIRLDNMYFIDNNTGFVSGFKTTNGPAGLYGVIYKTTNAGISFTKTTFSRVFEIDDFTFLNSTTGIAMGVSKPAPNNTIIYRTTNAGIQWDSISSLSGRCMYNIESLPSTGTAFAVGNMADTINGISKISTIKTTNYGTNWVVKDINQIIYMTGLSLNDQNNFMMSGTNLNASPFIPIIFKSTNGGNVFVNQIGSSIPTTFSLGQNYPNPFNPMCNIQFSMRNAGNVRLVVYDVQGREVHTLVNEKLSAGTYEVKFDGSALTSGIYFYKLVTEGFTETKRMLLIK